MAKRSFFFLNHLDLIFTASVLHADLKKPSNYNDFKKKKKKDLFVSCGRSQKS